MPTLTRPTEPDLDEQVTSTADPVKAYLSAIGRTPLLTAEQEVELAQRIEVGLYAAHLAAAGDTTSATHAELTELAADGRRARAHMLEANLRLVVSIAKRYPLRGLSFLDIVQEGNLGLVRAVEKFDYTKGFKFSTYATWWVRQAIGRAMAEQSRTVRLPVHMVEKVSKMERTERVLRQELGRDPSLEELATAYGGTPAEIEDLRRVSRSTVSLDTPVGDDGETRVGDLVVDRDAPDAMEIVEQRAMNDLLHRALAGLPEREATILALRFGLVDGRRHTLDEIGRQIGLTRERVRQLEKQALTELRHPSRADALLDFAA